MKSILKNTLILFNEYIYNEIDLGSFNKEKIIIANYGDCDIKLRMDVAPFTISLIRKFNYWEIVNSEGVYYVINGIKAKRKKLLHGDNIILKDNNQNELFKINFFLDFSSGKENYDRGIDISAISEVKIGRASNNEIVIEDTLVDEYHCLIKKEADKFCLLDLKSKYNVYLNGRKVNEKAMLNENDFIIVCGYKFLFKESKVLFSKQNEKIKIINKNIKEINTTLSLVDYPAFIRPPRLIWNLPEDKIEIVAPPTKEEKQGLETFLNLIPMLGMTVMMTVMSTGRAAMRIGMFCITVFSTVLLFVVNSKKVKKKLKDRNEMYRKYLTDREGEIVELYDKQKQVLTTIYPTVDEAIDTVNYFERRLWEKDFSHKDFLEVFIGKGSVDISFDVKIPKEEFGKREDELLLLPREVKDKYKKIEDMPITLNLKSNSSIGIVGERDNITSFVNNLIIEVAAYHCSEDVNIICVCEDEDIDKWTWMRWLPHIWSKDRKVRFMGAGKESSHKILEVINDVLVSRSEISAKSNSGYNGSPHYILIVTNPKLLENEQISKILEGDIKTGITTLYVYGHLELLPMNCNQIVEVVSDNNGKLTDVLDSGNWKGFEFIKRSISEYEDVARRLGPIYLKKNFSDNALPKSITLYELYGVKAARQLPIMENWGTNDVCKSIAAPLGVDAAQEIISLNLHEKFHGPHGLVAGTTGSGKSEILQSLIISLAINYHPYDVSFILIDYKGGGMANLFRDLPHLIGTITNLDGNLVNRSLSLIKSELKRRQRIFSKFDVNHIDGYKKLEKNDPALEPLPHLIIIADEFAELKSDQPEFMKELVSTARIGRSLGVHLILATQKPTGVVDSQIWSNSKFKLCLKVQDASDSNEMLKKPDAASIVEPGRAYFQVGNNEMYLLFQSAWSGASKYEDDDISNDDIEISKVSIEGIREVIYSSKKENEGKKQITLLDECVLHINKIFNENGFKRVDDCWVPPLDDIIYLNDLIEGKEYFYNKESSIELDINPVVGIVDCPDLQQKLPMRYNLCDDGNLFMLGGSGYGKTTFIQTLVTSLSLNYSPKDVNIYILDFGSRTLKLFENMPQVGGVILSDDEEKIKNLFKIMRKEIVKRKELFSDVGASSLKNYRLASNNAMSQIVIILDNYIAFKELYEQFQDELLFLTREGPGLGICLVLTNSASNGVPYKLISNFKNKLAVTCIEKSEYMSIVGTSRISPTNLKGRALVNFNGTNEMQIAIWGKSEQEFERANELKELIKLINDNYKGRKAPKVATSPEVVNLEDMYKEIDFGNEEELTIPCGFDSDNLENIMLPLKQYPSFTLIGEAKSGKSNMIQNIIYTSNLYWKNCEFIIFDSQIGALKSISQLECITKYAKTAEEYVETVEMLLEEGERRKDSLSQLINENPIKSQEELLETMTTLVVVVDNIADMVKNLDRKQIDKLEPVVRELKTLKVHIIAAGTDNDFKTNLYSVRFLKAMKESQFGIVFDSLNNQNYFGVRLRYNTKEAEFKKGDGYLILNNKFNRIKTPKMVKI